MTCTNDTLKRLKELLTGCETSASSLPLDEMVIAVGYSEMKAVLARLESAEVICRHLDRMDREHKLATGAHIDIQKWRKEAGFKPD